MENTPQRSEAPPPGRIEDLLIVIAVIHHVLSQQEVQVMMAVFVNQIVDEIQIVPIEAVDEGQAGPVPITEAHDALRLERHDP